MVTLYPYNAEGERVCLPTTRATLLVARLEQSRPIADPNLRCAAPREACRPLDLISQGLKCSDSQLA